MDNHTNHRNNYASEEEHEQLVYLSLYLDEGGVWCNVLVGD